jgi:endonuclease/exonuclease/phosphatase family metal-dependent hydrolase
VGRGRAATRGLRDLIRDTDADVVLLQEAKNYVTAIRAAFPGWRVYGGIGFRESSNCVVMVRRTVTVGKRGRVRNRTPWTYAHKGRSVVHPGRVWRWVEADGVTLMAVHRATNALSLNEKAGREEADNLIEWLESHPRAIAAGDWNNRPVDNRPNGPAEIARHGHARLVVAPGADIDFAAVRGVEVTARLGDRYGSDHHSQTYTIEEI